MTEMKGWEGPHPGDVGTMRQFWDAMLDRLAAFMQAKQDRRAATPSRPPKPPSRNDEPN